MTYCKHGLGAIPQDTRSVFARPNKSQKKFIQIESIVMEALAEVDLSSFFTKKGQWGIHPIRVCSLLLLQAMEGLTDAQTEEAINLNVGWKYVLHLGLNAVGWDSSVLSEHRDRFDEEAALKVFVDSILAKANEKGLLDRSMQRMDSTFVVAHVKALNNTELFLESVRNVLEETTEEAFDWIDSIRLEHWLKTYYLDRPFNFRIPKEEKKRTKIAEETARDGFYILDCVDAADAKTRAVLSKLESIRTLKRVLDEHFHTEGKGKNRKSKLKKQSELAPSGERIVSPHEPDARVAMKRDKTIVGFRTHTSETCTPGFPNLITHVQTEAATLNDSLSLESIVRSMAKRGLLPKKLFLDGGYVNADIFAKLAKSLGIDFVARLANGHSWQSKQGKGFDLSNFFIDWKKRTATCPGQARSQTWKNDGTGGANVYFSPKDCGPCPFKENCAKGKFRVLHLKAKPVYRYMAKMRTRQNTTEFAKEYAIRAGVEGLQSQLINRHGRKTNVRTRSKVSLKLILAVASLNISRLISWNNNRPKSTTRKGKYQLAFAAA